jgi:hypothetical protein
LAAAAGGLTPANVQAYVLFGKQEQHGAWQLASGAAAAPMIKVKMLKLS